MPYKDLREYLDLLEREGELIRIKEEVDWNLEIGAIIRRSHKLRSEAPFFENIKDFSSDFRGAAALAGPSRKPDRYFSRIALTMDMKPETKAIDIMEEYLKRKKNPLKPVIVSSGPCKDNIISGKDVDLYKFPAPYLHQGDGGRYIGTWCTVITKDPDTGWVNWGTYRQMIHEKNIMGGLFNPMQHMGTIFYQKYEARGIPMEFATAIGLDPILSLVSVSKYNPGIDEVSIAGALRGEPVELVKCETVDLLCPAHAEIVIEGVIPPHKRREEGPFGEFTGYMAGLRAPRPVYEVRAITHRNRPILTMMCPGFPVDDDHNTMHLTSSASLMQDLRERGFPVKMVYQPPNTILTSVISTKVPFANYPGLLANAVWGSPYTQHAHILIVVDEDIDPTNMDEVLWALTTRMHPDKGVYKMTGIPGVPLLPCFSAEEKKYNKGASILFDCTWPKEWPAEAIPTTASFEKIWPDDLQKKVIERWKDYGYKD